jgi:hypothetical protein
MAVPPGPGTSTRAGGITMLGARQTGKTTFLAALQIALLRRSDLGWALVSDNKASAQVLTKFVTDMTDKHIFPAPTDAIENYQWSLEGELPPYREWDRWRFRRRRRFARIPLDLIDAPGEITDSDIVYSADQSTLFTDNLAHSAGIVLFFDPITEFTRGDAFRNMYGVLTLLRSQLRGNGRLPHWVAVCITKFDEIAVYEAASKLRILEIDPYPPEFPRVPDEDGRTFFERLARLSKSDSADLVLPLLGQTFYEQRIKFFVTSAIGFFVDSSYGVFDPDDYQNHIPRENEDGLDYIRGGIRPINVIEPVLWLGRNVARVTP